MNRFRIGYSFVLTLVLMAVGPNVFAVSGAAMEKALTDSHPFQVIDMSAVDVADLGFAVTIEPLEHYFFDNVVLDELKAQHKSKVALQPCFAAPFSASSACEQRMSGYQHEVAWTGAVPRGVRVQHRLRL
jgi:hypothetical protein